MKGLRIDIGNDTKDLTGIETGRMSLWADQLSGVQDRVQQVYAVFWEEGSSAAAQLTRMLVSKDLGR